MAADIRERIRLPRSAGTEVSQAQADVLTLTLTQVQVRSIQNWVRAAGVIDSTGWILVATVTGVDAGAVKVGQRARVFTPDSKSSMLQAKITRVTRRADTAVIEARLSAQGHGLDSRYVLEVVVDYGEFLSVPNEAIVEEGGRQLVYISKGEGSYQPRQITTRLQGERYTQVVEGVEAGEQVVTTGSFFVDAEYRMKGGN
jgi:Cu(I)/Ag(I) efflux system membrane fusion protein